MAQPQVIEGTWEEIAEHAHEFQGGQRFRLVPLPSASEKPILNKPGEMIRKGMFPQLRDLTEEDFKAAEWRGEDTNF
jgi:hypothetical protein